MRTKIRGFSIIIFSIVFALLMTACEEPLEGLQGEQGVQGAEGKTPWICVDGFWHIGGTPDECDENCTGIAVGGAAGEQAQLVITKPTKTTYTACVDGVFNTAGLIVSFQHQNALIPINPVNYVLLWNDGVIENGNTAITAEAGTKTIYVIDITGRMGEFSITVIAEHNYSEWTIKTAAACLAKEVQERTCTFCGDVQTQEVGEPLGHSYGNWTTKTAATCVAKEMQERTCISCGEVQTQEVGEPLQQHSYSSWTTKTVATCTAKEVQERTCSSCGDYQTQEVGEPLQQHSYSSWTTKTAATCFTKEVQERTCSSCGDYQTQEVGESLGGHNITWVERDGFEGELCQNTGCHETRGEIRLTLEIGDEGPAGGIIFYVADGQEGRPLGFTVQGYGNPGDEGYFASYAAFYIEAAPANMATGLRWSTLTEAELREYNYDPSLVIDIPGTGTAIGTGRKNTALILALDSTAPAALACNDYFVAEYESFDDWFLPSLDELELLYISDFGFSLLDSSWSSSQLNWDSYSALVLYDIGSRERWPKGVTCNVRAVRAF